MVIPFWPNDNTSPEDKQRGFQGGGANRRGSRRASRAAPWQCDNMRLTGCIRPMRASDLDLTVPISARKPGTRNAERAMAWQR